MSENFTGGFDSSISGRFITGQFITGRYNTVSSSRGRFITRSIQHRSIHSRVRKTISGWCSPNRRSHTTSV